ncbi:Flp pilus assembly protein, secretin CpaC [Raoultella ornithinolytica]|nr:Flp pilus assembly protein, secretin CpaC [Raoultella ornithinolytica]
MAAEKSNGSNASSENTRFAIAKVYNNVINRLQLPSSNQVNVKLTVVEVSKEFTDNLGIEWSSLTLDSIITAAEMAA